MKLRWINDHRSGVLNWYAKKRGKVNLSPRIAKFFYLDRLYLCDTCGHNFVHETPITVEYKTFKPLWSSKGRITGWRYEHTHYADCKKNKIEQKKHFGVTI